MSTRQDHRFSLGGLHDLKVQGRSVHVPIMWISFILFAFGISNHSIFNRTPIGGCKTTSSTKPRANKLVGTSTKPRANKLVGASSAISSTVQNENTAVADFFFSRARGDRSGAVIEDMIFALAYAFQHNLTYKGACVGSDVSKRLLERHWKLMNILGLEEILHFACPGKNHKYHIFSGSVYRDERLLTPKFLDWIRKQRRNTGAAQNDTSSSKVVVHIRRGDVSLCNINWFRYTPNLYYLSILDHLTDSEGFSYKPEEVTVHSESKSMESFAAFEKYNVVLDGELSSVYHQMVNSEVLVLGRSSFSTVPALLNPNKVIYNSNWHEPLDGWYAVDNSLLQMVDIEASRLRKKYCGY